MKCRRLSWFTLTMVTLTALAIIARGDTRADWPAPYFFDDFEDGNATDGRPVSWVPEVPPYDGGTRQVIDGDFVVTPGDTPFVSSLGTSYENDTVPFGVTPLDASIRMLVRDFSPGDFWIGVGARYRESLGLGVAGGLGSTGRIFQGWYEGSEYRSIPVWDTDIDVTATDVHFQFDLIGAKMSLTVWPDGEDKPSRPQLSSVLPGEYVEPGTLAVWYSSFQGPDPVPASIEYFAVLPTPYATLVRGDFDETLIVDAADIDALRPGSSDLKYDVNLDGVVDVADREFWVDGVNHTWFGDADLNGEFSSADFVTVFRAGKYEGGAAAGWAEGDWNGDGLFDSVDFVTAFQDGGYEQGPRTSVAAVPEPGAMSLLLLGLLSWLVSRFAADPMRRPWR